MSGMSLCSDLNVSAHAFGSHDPRRAGFEQSLFQQCVFRVRHLISNDLRCLRSVVESEMYLGCLGPVSCGARGRWHSVVTRGVKSRTCMSTLMTKTIFSFFVFVLNLCCSFVILYHALLAINCIKLSDISRISTEIALRCHWTAVKLKKLNNICSGCGSVLSGNKPLSELMSQFYEARWCLQGFFFCLWLGAVLRPLLPTWLNVHISTEK